MRCFNPAHLTALSAALSLWGCDGQQYVSPETVQLVITKEGSPSDLVDRCNYMPVLLGSTVKARYVIEDDLKATLTIMHDSVTVGFDGAADTFKVSKAELGEGPRSAPKPPPGYVVELSFGCTPEEP